MAPGVAGLLLLKNKMIQRVKGFHFTTASYSSSNMKRSQNSLPLMGGTSSSNLVEEVLSLDNPFAISTDACFKVDAYFQVAETSTAQVN